MKIIRINPQAVTDKKENPSRVLTFANGSYALQYRSADNISTLDMFDYAGKLIKSGVKAESCYIFKNGNYILLYEARLNSNTPDYLPQYRMFNRQGKLLQERIDQFVPLLQDWVVLVKRGIRYLYDDKLQLISEACGIDFIKFDGGYAKVSSRKIPAGEAAPLMPGDAGKWLPFNNRMKRLYKAPQDQDLGIAFDWELFNDKQYEEYLIRNGLSIFGGGYCLAMYHDGKVFFHYPDGNMGAETTLYSGVRKNIACLVNLSLTKMSPEESRGETIITYRYGKERNGNYTLPYSLQKATDFYEFSNGNFSCVIDNNLCFFEEGSDEPLVTVPQENTYFLPDGSYWREDTKELYDRNHQQKDYNVKGIIDYGDWYVLNFSDGDKVYDLEGKIIASGVKVIRKINGLLAIKTPMSESISFLHRQTGCPIMPGYPEAALSYEESVF